MQRKSCIKMGVLKDYLLKAKGEALDMILTEYNETLHNKTLREEGFESGKIEGIAIGESRGIFSSSSRIYRNMRKKGYSKEESQELTGLTSQQIEEIEKDF